MGFILKTLALFAALSSLTVLLLVLGAFADPTRSLFAVVGSMVWATYGPFLLLAAIAATFVGVAARVAGAKRLGALILAHSMLALIGAIYILSSIVLAGNRAGATIDLWSTLLLDDMQVPVPDVVETFDTIDGTELRAAVYRPVLSEGVAPVIVYVHGGGFMTGSFTETAADLKWFAKRGWLVVSVEYRLFTPGDPTWNKAMRDVTCGLAWATRNAARFGGNPERIAVLGDSAGGNLAINVGFSVASGQATSDCSSAVIAPLAIAVLYPAVDVASIYNDGFPIPGFEPKMLIEGYVGGPPDAYPDRVAAVSSATYLTAEAPPTLIVLPENDSLVVSHGTEAFVQDAKAAEIDVELVRIPFANHIFNQLAANSLGNQIGRTLRLQFIEENVR